MLGWLLFHLGSIGVSRSLGTMGGSRQSIPGYFEEPGCCPSGPTCHIHAVFPILAPSVLVAHSMVIVGNPRFYPFEEPGLGHVLALLPPKWPDLSCLDRR
jgi:hypothetical protein